MIPLLEPLFQGNWAAYGETLSCEPAPAGAVGLDRLLAEPALLQGLLLRHAAHLGCQDLRPVVANWALNYFLMLLPPFVAAASVLQHRFPMVPAELALSCHDDGLPARLYLPHQGQFLPGSTLAQRYDELVWLHLEPLIAALAAQGRVASRLLWGNATRYLKDTLDQLQQLTGNPAPLRDDSMQLLSQAHWPDGRANPLFGRLRHAERGAAGARSVVTLHRECCLKHMLPGQQHCLACPLASAAHG